MATQHVKLNIVWGLPKAPGDPYSAEKGIEYISLLQSDGFLLESPSGWIPQIASVKGGGVFADSAISDGAVLLSGVRDNVTETMTLIADTATLATRQALLTKLNRYAQLCEDFWEGDTQIDPVYLEWQAPGAPGEQYALIYTMEVAEQDDPFSEPYAANASRLVITLRREPFWRGIPPGANPAVWTLEGQRGLQPGSGYTYTSLRLYGGGGSPVANPPAALLNQTFATKFEWVTTGANAYDVPATLNYVEIDGSLIPGDAPALLMLSCFRRFSGGDIPAKFYIGVESRDMQFLAHNAGTTITTTPTFNAGDGTLLAGSKILATSDETVVSNSSASQYVYEATVTAATTTLTEFIRFSGLAAVADLSLGGTWAVFVRMRQVTAGALGDVRARIDLPFLTGISSSLNLPEFRVQLTTNTIPLLHYAGQFRIPVGGSKSVQYVDGYGANPNSQTGVVSLYMRNAAGANRTVRVTDVWFMPIDQGMATLNSSGATGDGGIIFDGTGYLMRAQPGGIAGFVSTALSSGSFEGTFSPREMIGNVPVLMPGVTNRIHILNTIRMGALGGLEASPTTYTYNGSVFIVPRWLGARS